MAGVDLRVNEKQLAQELELEDLPPENADFGPTRSEAEDVIKTSKLGYNEKDFRVFTPQWFYDVGVKNNVENNEKLREVVYEISQNRLKSKIPRLVVMCVIPLVAMAIIRSDNKSEINIATYFGCGLIAMFVAYFAHLFFIFLGKNAQCPEIGKECCGGVERPIKALNKIEDSNYLFRVYSLNSIVDDWTSMAICYQTIIFENQPIASISEFSAIAGGFAQTMLLVLSVYSWSLLIAIEGYATQGSMSYQPLGLSSILEIMGCFGLVLIGSYELDPFNKTMQNIHNGGAAMGAMTVVGYFYQQIRLGIVEKNNWPVRLIPPILLSIIAATAFFMWQYFKKQSRIYANDVSKKYWAAHGDGSDREVASKVPSMDSTKMASESAASDTESGAASPVSGNSAGGQASPRAGIRLKDPKIKEAVTALTLKNVVSEAIFLFCGALSMCLYMISITECFDNFGKNCP